MTTLPILLSRLPMAQPNPRTARRTILWSNSCWQGTRSLRMNSRFCECRTVISRASWKPSGKTSPLRKKSWRSHRSFPLPSRMIYFGYSRKPQMHSHLQQCQSLAPTPRSIIRPEGAAHPQHHLSSPDLIIPGDRLTPWTPLGPASPSVGARGFCQ